MNERLTIQDLTDLLAAKHSMTKKDADVFVKEFFLLIEQALENEKTVKIKGLGTFKLIDVDSRESVKVNTGERFQIKGHTKVSFSPDPSLRDTINKPFAHFETVVLNENTILEDTPIEDVEEEETGEEITDLSNEIITEKTVNEDINVSHETKDQLVFGIESKEQEEVIEKAETVIVKQQESEIPIIEKEKMTAEQIIEQELMRANLKPEIPSQSKPEKKAPAEKAVKPNIRKKASSKEKSPVPYLITIIIIVLLLCGSVVLFLYYPDLFSSSPDKDTHAMQHPVQPEMQLADTIKQKEDTVSTVTPVVQKTITEQQPVSEKEKVVTSVKIENKPVPQQPPAPVLPDSASYKITGTKTKYTIKEGETLTRVSLRFYGTKAMWPYIVKHNPDVIKNPNHVPYGTTIKIPELTKE